MPSLQSVSVNVLTVKTKDHIAYLRIAIGPAPRTIGPASSHSMILKCLHSARAGEVGVRLIGCLWGEGWVQGLVKLNLGLRMLYHSYLLVHLHLVQITLTKVGYLND